MNNLALLAEVATLDDFLERRGVEFKLDDSTAAARRLLLLKCLIGDRGDDASASTSTSKEEKEAKEPQPSTSKSMMEDLPQPQPSTSKKEEAKEPQPQATNLARRKKLTFVPRAGNDVFDVLKQSKLTLEEVKIDGSLKAPTTGTWEDTAELDCRVLGECQKLKSLILNVTVWDAEEQIHRSRVKNFIELPQSIKSLEIHGALEISDVVELLDRLPNLEYLQTTECDNTYDSMQMFVKVLKHSNLGRFRFFDVKDVTPFAAAASKTVGVWKLRTKSTGVRVKAKVETITFTFDRSILKINPEETYFESIPMPIYEYESEDSEEDEDSDEEEDQEEVEVVEENIEIEIIDLASEEEEEMEVEERSNEE